MPAPSRPSTCAGQRRHHRRAQPEAITLFLTLSPAGLTYAHFVYGNALRKASYPLRILGN